MCPPTLHLPLCKLGLMNHRIAQSAYHNKKKNTKTINEPAGVKWGLKMRQRTNLTIQVLPKQQDWVSSDLRVFYNGIKKGAATNSLITFPSFSSIRPPHPAWLLRRHFNKMTESLGGAGTFGKTSEVIVMDRRSWCWKSLGLSGGERLSRVFGQGGGAIGGCCCRSVSDKGSQWVAGGVMFFIRSSTRCILPTLVGAKGRADTWQQPAPFCLTPEFTLIHKKYCGFYCVCIHVHAWRGTDGLSVLYHRMVMHKDHGNNWSVLSIVTHLFCSLPSPELWEKSTL